MSQVTTPELSEEKTPEYCKRGSFIRDQLESMDLEEGVFFLEPANIFDPAIVGMTEGDGDIRLVYLSLA